MTNGSTSSSWKVANGMIKPPSSSYQTIGKAAKFLKLDFSAEDMAAFAKEYEMTTDSLRCIEELFDRMQENKQKNIVRTLLKLSRLPKKEPKTFDTFDFGRCFIANRLTSWRICQHLLRCIPGLISR